MLGHGLIRGSKFGLVWPIAALQATTTAQPGDAEPIEIAALGSATLASGVLTVDLATPTPGLPELHHLISRDPRRTGQTGSVRLVR